MLWLPCPTPPLTITSNFPITAVNEDQVENSNLFMVDLSKKIDIIRDTLTLCSSKEYISGRIEVEPNFDYLVVLANPTQLFPSTTILHLIELVSKEAVSPAYEVFLQAPSHTFINDMMEAPKVDPEQKQDEDQHAKIADLLSFVEEIAKSDTLVKDCKKQIAKMQQGGSADNWFDNAIFPNDYLRT